MRFVKFWFSALFLFTAGIAAAAAPDYSNLGAASNNADTTWAKAADIITFTLDINVAEDSDGTGLVTFDVGTLLGQTATFPAAASSTSHTATYLVPGGANGAISVTGLTFQNTSTQAIVSVPGFPITPSSTVTVDTTAPVLASIGAASSNADTTKAKAADSVTFTVTLVTADTWIPGNTLNYSIGAGASTPLPSAFVSTAGTVTKISGTRSVTVNIPDTGLFNIDSLTFTDRAGNAITGFAAGAPTPNVTADTTAPSVTGTLQLSSNVNAGFAKAGDTVTYTVTYDESVTVSTVNTASSASNATGAITEVSAVASTTDTLVATVQGGDNGLIAPTVDFDITDAAGNVTTITSLAPITGGSGSNTITADTMVPTITPVTIASDNANTDWAKTGDKVTVSFTGSEALTGVSSTMFAGIPVLSTNPGGNNWTAERTTNGTETEGLVSFTLDFQDLAGNTGTQVTAVTDASSVTFDKTAPTLPLVSIASNNALDTTLAKSNDTITVTFTVADNLATTASISGAPTILSSAATDTVTTVGAGQTIARFTDGSETSEVVVPFSFAVQDQAGNVSATTTATTDASQVKFDRTDPIVTNVGITATSFDLSAFLGDAPTYYAKQGDTVDLVLQICDYVDSNSNPPTGTIFTLPTVFADQGLVGAPGNCTTGAGNLSQFREWKGTVAGINGIEGVVPFSVDGKDNAGNVLIPSVTGTTNGSSVIFDKTNPTVPTDMVDLGGAATLGYKPAANAALYTWTNDADPLGGAPVSGVYQFDVRYNNPNTAINEMVTITAPTRSFAPSVMIPDLAPYTVNMDVRDKAGNASGEAVIYTQKYGIEVKGTVTDKETGAPIVGAAVNLIAPSGSVCNNPNQETCSAITDGSGNYLMTVAPNTTYKVDGIKAPDYYIAKADLKTTTVDVVSNIQLQHVADGDVQTGNQGTIITLDLAFEINGVPQTTYVNVFSSSGEVTVNQTADGIVITSFGTITQISSNNPGLVINQQTTNKVLIKTPVNILNISDAKNPGSSVSSTFASGSNRVGTSGNLGGASAGFQAGMSRSDRVVNGFWSEEQSREFARMLNRGTDYKVNQYVNRNGHMVFAGYQHGRMAIADMTGSDPNIRMRKQIVYRGPRRGTERTFRNVLVADRKEVIKTIFYTDHEDDNRPLLVVEEGNQQKAARPRVETKKTEMTYNNPELRGYGRRVEMYPSVYNKKANDARYVNKFARTVDTSGVTPSRMQGKNTNMIVLRGKSRNGKKLALGQMFHQNPQLITQRQRVVLR